MKKLSTKEKAELYDKAIKKAKSKVLYPGKPYFVNIKDIFPELVESEDLEIKSDIQYAVRCVYGDNSSKTERILAWLDKQGELVEINPTEFDTRLQALIGKSGSLPKEELIGSLSFWMNVVQNDGTYKPAEKQGEQKSTNSKEDDVRRVSTIQVLEYAKSLPDYNQFGKDAICKNIAWLEKQSEQNKQQLYDIIIALWDLLDKIDTFSDLQIDDTNPNNPFRKIEHITQERHKFVKTDGYNLFINDFMITNKKIEKKGEKKSTFDVEIPFGVKDSELKEATYFIPKGFYAEITGNEVRIKRGKIKFNQNM